LDLYPTYHPTGEVQVLQKAWKLFMSEKRGLGEQYEKRGLGDCD
jgi:hypothetical protein